MATSTIAPGQLASSMAKSVPSELSQSPLLGILGVITGAGIVTLTGRMLTLGLADMKGDLGISFDDGAWISSAYNCALMFMGPLTVFLGGLLGPRRILMWSASAFTLICCGLPFVHGYGLFITGLVMAGLASGTFYPLTLTFALRNIPLKFLPFTLALYATFVDGAVNVAPSLYGWYRDHLSWHWMFWSIAALTVFMMACIYWGIPESPARKNSGTAPSFAGLLSAGLGFSMLFAVLDQGERLDWQHSGLIIALVSGGALFLLAMSIRRLRGPNPLVDLAFLLRQNTLLMGMILILFRFGLLATIILIPQTLSIHGLQADQIGPAIIWTAAPQLVIACIAAWLLLRKLDSRLLMAIGFTCMAFASWMNAGLTSAWSAENYYSSELLMAVGQSFAFIGVVSTTVLNALFSGALTRAPAVLTYSAYFHLVRLFGGQMGVAFMTHFIAQREKMHSNLVGLHVQTGSARGLPLGLVSGRIRLQAYTLTFIDGFNLIAAACVVALLLIAFLRKSPLSYGDLGGQS